MKKYEFGKFEVKHLRHIVGLVKFHVDKEKVQSVKYWPRSTSKKKLQKFLGFANYFDKFIRSIDHITLLIPKLLKQLWIWGIE